MSSLETSAAKSDSKPVSSILFRTIAGLIDCILIAIIDSALMYAFWVIGMASGLLDARPEHWAQLLYTIPLFLLDGLSGIAAPIAMVYLNLAGAFPEKTLNLANAFFLCIMVVNWLYHAEFESSNTRGTPGKLAMDLAVVNARNGGPIGFASASFRHFAKFLSSAILFIGYLPIFGRDKRSLHDLISNCAVSSES
ncbi:MAG: RDD family protein [Candidatus Melainabacteria bacterium]|nr:RDD family protein [Candidatus Melainabacteria bacterium]